MSPPPKKKLEVTSFWLGLFYPVSATTVVCCILMQLLCVVSQKKLLFPLDSAGDLCPPDPQSSFMSTQ